MNTALAWPWWGVRKGETLSLARFFGAWQRPGWNRFMPFPNAGDGWVPKPLAPRTFADRFCVSVAVSFRLPWVRT
jgi:hypothetical protein